MSTLKEDLIKAREKIEKGWCQRVTARNATGRAVPYNAPEAVCFCILGAVLAVTEYPTYSIETLFKALRARSVGSISLNAYNDSRTKRDVLSLFDDAIKLAEETK